MPRLVTKLSMSLGVALQTLVQDGDIERVLSCYRDLMTQRDVTLDDLTQKDEAKHRVYDDDGGVGVDGKG